MDEYKRFLAIWDLIHVMNAARIFTYGRADHGPGGPVITFETPDQQQRYREIFETTE